MTTVFNPIGLVNVNSVPQEEQLATKNATTSASPELGLPDPLGALILSDDAIAQIVGLLAKSFREDRKEARKLTNLQEQHIARETAERVKNMREAAERTQAAGFAKGMTMMAGGALTVAGAGLSLGDGGSTTHTTSEVSHLEGANGPTTVTDTLTQTQQAPAWAAFGEGGGRLVQGGGEFAAAAYGDLASAANERAVLHEAAADRAKRAGDEYRGEADDARRMLEKVAEFLKSVRDSQNASSQAALRRA